MVVKGCSLFIAKRLYNDKNKVIRRLIAPRAKWRRLYSKLASAVARKWFVEVVYGYQKDVFGKRVLFKNTGIYNNVGEAKEALRAFIE